MHLNLNIKKYFKKLKIKFVCSLKIYIKIDYTVLMLKLKK